MNNPSRKKVKFVLARKMSVRRNNDCEIGHDFDPRDHRKPSGPCYPSGLTTSGMDKGLGVSFSHIARNSFLPPANTAGPGSRIDQPKDKHARDRLNQPGLMKVRSGSYCITSARLAVVGEIPRRLQHGAGVPEYRLKTASSESETMCLLRTATYQGTVLPQPGTDPICL